MKNLSSLIFTIAVLFFAVNQIHASCPSVVQHPPCAEYWRADAVFIATATKVETEPKNFGEITPPSTVHFAVEESFKGIDGNQFVLEQKSCGHQFKEGEKYLVYAHRDSNDGKLFVRLGSTRTKLLSESAEDLEYLRSLQRGETQAQIVGKIGQQTAEIKHKQNTAFDYDWYFFGAPLAGVKVFAKNGEQIFETFSDQKGKYKFFGLPTGNYEIWADYPTYFESRKEKVQTKTEGCGVGNIKGWRKGLIGGRVTDVNGKPVKDILLSLVSADASPQEIFEESENESVWYLTSTNEKGEYHFTMLPAGSYYIVINRTNFERARANEKFQTIPRIFYPNVKNLDKASVISIEEGEQVKGKDFRLPKINQGIQ